MPNYVNEGGTVFVVELGRDVEKGEKFQGSAALADNFGFVLVEGKKKADPPKDEE